MAFHGHHGAIRPEKIAPVGVSGSYSAFGTFAGTSARVVTGFTTLAVLVAVVAVISVPAAAPVGVSGSYSAFGAFAGTSARVVTGFPTLAVLVAVVAVISVPAAAAAPPLPPAGAGGPATAAGATPGGGRPSTVTPWLRPSPRPSHAPWARGGLGGQPGQGVEGADRTTPPKEHSGLLVPGHKETSIFRGGITLVHLATHGILT